MNAEMNRERRSQKRVVLYRAAVPDEPEPYEVVYKSVADALHFACRDLRTGRRQPVAIVEDGVMLLDAAAIATECESIAESDRPAAAGATELDADSGAAER